MNENRRSYTPEFKEEAVHLAESRGVSATSRDLGINPSLIHAWKRKMKAKGTRAFPGKGNPRDAELAVLHRKLRRAEEENAILKKAVGILTTRPRRDTVLFKIIEDSSACVPCVTS